MHWLIMITALLKATSTVNADEDIQGYIRALSYAARFVSEPLDAIVEKGVRESAKVSFFCHVDGNPAPTVEWKRNGKDISRLARYVVIKTAVGMSSLRIEPVRNADNNSEISCTADNGVGHPIEATAKLLLMRTGDLPSGFPEITSHPRLKAVEKGRTAQVQCTAKGEPRPDIVWLRDLLPVDIKGNSRYTVSTLGNPAYPEYAIGSLIIQNSSEMDEGKYECIARNRFGVIHSKAAHLYVKVRRVPPHFSIPPEKHYKVVPGGSLNLTCVAVGYPMPKVFWRKGHMELTDPASAPVGRNILYLPKVDQTTNFTCVAVSKLGNIEAVTTVEVKALPPPPKQLRVTEETENTVSLEWAPVAGAPGAEIKHYVVQYRPKNDSATYTEGNEYHESEAIADMKLTVTGLQPYQEYEFRVLAANSVGRGSASAPVHAETAEARPESPPENVQARAISGTTIMVQWDPPEKANGKITEYRIFFSQNKESPIVTWKKHDVKTDTRLVTIPDLKSDSIYYVRVQAVNSKGAGPTSDTATVITKIGIPGQPINIKAIPAGPHTIELSWEGSVMSTNIAGYVIKHNGTPDGSFVEMEIYRKDADSLAIRNLKPDTTYSFQVAAKSSRGQGAFSPPVVAKTTASVPTGAPKITQVEKLGPDSLRVSWDPPPRDKLNGPLQAYRIRWARVSVPGGSAGSDEFENSIDEGSFIGSQSSFATYSPTAETSGDGEATQLSDKPRIHTIKNLKTWTLYRITVAAGTLKGFGPESNPVEERTAEDVPTAPRNLKVDPVNATAVRLRWQRPKSPNGVLAGYNVYKEELRNGETVQGTYLLIELIRNPDRMQTLIGRLKPNTEYAFRVSAVNQEGDGIAAWKKMVTGGMPPSAPIFLSLNLTRKKPPIKARIAWTEPKVTHGMKVKLYKLRYKPIDDIDYSQKQTEHKEVDIDGLFMGRKYEFLLVAVNNDGDSEQAVAYLETPVGVPEGPPVNIRWFVRDDHRLEFTWDPPSKNVRNGEITEYQTVLKSDRMPEPMIKTVSIPSTNYIINEDTTYEFQVSGGTSQGFGPPSQWFAIDPSTKAVIPVPKNVRAQGIGRTEIVVQWDPLENVDEYQVRYSKEPKSDTSEWMKVSVMGRNSRDVVLRGLDPLSDYAVCVVAVKGVRVGECSEERVIVKSEPQYVVENLKADRIGSHSVRLSWDYNGRGPVDFYFSGIGRKMYIDQFWEVRNVSFLLSPNPPTVEGVNQHVLTSLRPWTEYKLKVGVVRGSTREHYWARSVEAKTLASLPPFVDPPEFIGAPNTRHVDLKLKRAPEEYGPVSHYLLVVVPANVTRNPETYTNEELLALTNKRNKGLNDAFITANISSAYMDSLRPKRKPTPNYALFKIGTGVSEGGIMNSPLPTGRRYKTFLRAFVDKTAMDPREDKVFLDSIYSESFGSVKKGAAAVAAKSGHLWLIGPVVAILVITVIVGMLMIYWMKRRGKKNAKQLPMKPANISKVALGSPHGPTETSKLLVPDTYANNNVHGGATILPGYDPVMSGAINGIGGDPMEMRQLGAYAPVAQTPGMVSHPPIPITELAGHIERLKANDNALFSQEYESIETGQQFTWEHSNMEVNKPKNRYANVIAYDHSRVILSTVDGITGSDYVNANYIDGYRKPKAYIATQGPLPETFADFWRMVWEENTAVILMLTKLEERTRVKCDQYWPVRGSMWYGLVQVSLCETFELAHYTIRTLRIQKRGEAETRDIRHMQFTAWPDHGVPDHPTPFLMFLKRVKSLNPPDAGPVISHCSAGVGRSGAYIVIDCMLDRLRFENTVDIYGCVTSLRSQRNYMVQTEDQYVFIHDAVLDAVQSGSTEVPAGKLFTHIQALMQMQPLDNATGMELEFRHLAALRMPNARYLAANQPYNKHKNRLVNILPYDSTRVCLAPIAGGPEGSDYINASWVDGYRQRMAYIATQGPLPATADDFWRMLWEHNSCIIVVLTKLREMGREKCFKYWPSDRSERYGALVVEPIAEYNMPQYVLREFKMTDTQSGQTRTMRHFQYTEWPEQGVPKSGELFVEFIGQVHKTKEQFGAEGPITVHCSAGVGRTGVFIGLSIILERMRFENVVDVFTTVKLLRTQRSNMVQSEDQYHFCYQAALEYLGSFDHYANEQYVQ